jgi:hypothetical protein
VREKVEHQGTWPEEEDRDPNGPVRETVGDLIPLAAPVMGSVL